MIAPDIQFAGMPTNNATTLANAKEAVIDIAPRNPRQANVVIGGVAVGHPDVEEIALQDPTLFAAEVLLCRMEAHGIAGGTGAQAYPPPQASAVPTSVQVKETVDPHSKAS